MDLILSPDWSLLLTKILQRTPILIPMFSAEGVTWRLNPDGPAIKGHKPTKPCVAANLAIAVSLGRSKQRRYHENRHRDMG